MRERLVAIAVVIVFAGASFFFALAETALLSLSKWQARQLAERNPGSGNIVLRLLAEAQDLLATMVLGNTFASAAILATALWMALSGRWPLAITLVGLLALILLGCEVLPKTLAVRQPEQWALRVARPMLWLQTIAKPLRHLTDGDYQELLELAFQQGALAQTEKEIILQIISLDRRTAKEVMKPRAQMASISDDISIEE